MDEPITSFRGDFDFLSNFYECYVPMTFGKDNIPFEFRNAEAAFQAHKTRNFADLVIFSNMTGREAKKFGRKVKLRDDWNDVRLQIMGEVVLTKFVVNKDLRDKLIATGQRELIEGNTWRDTFWGVCNGKGENHLGKILMEVRAMLIRAQFLYKEEDHHE
jgi:ribA/ribD-fused uncharacterized protein